MGFEICSGSESLTWICWFDARNKLKKISSQMEGGLMVIYPGRKAKKTTLNKQNQVKGSYKQTNKQSWEPKVPPPKPGFPPINSRPYDQGL